jgi:hypothetical protein
MSISTAMGRPRQKVTTSVDGVTMVSFRVSATFFVYHVPFRRFMRFLVTEIDEIRISAAIGCSTENVVTS